MYPPQQNNMYSQPMMQGNPMVGQPLMAGQQPMPGIVIQVGQNYPVPWEVGPFKHTLCGCCDDMPSCLMSWLCPCVQYGQNYEQLHKDGCLQQGLLFLVLGWFGVPCIIHMGLRKQIRQKFNIPGDDCDDFLLTCCCGCCALAQETREIEYRKQEAARRGIPF